MAFADGLISIVMVKRDLQPRDSHGAVKQDYQPVPGQEAVPCRIVEQSSRDTEMAQRPGVVASGRVLFGQEVKLDHLCQLVYQDPSSGRTRVLTCRGQSRNAHQMNHHWVVEFDEFRT